MKRNLLDKAGADHSISRIQALQPSTGRRWGTMDATQMLQHCNLVNASILKGAPASKKATLKERLMRFIFFNVISEIPKNQKTPARIKEAADQQTLIKFEEERDKLIQTLQAFPERKSPMSMVHPKLGPLHTRQLGVFAWMHLDHHLRQFGL